MAEKKTVVQAHFDRYSSTWHDRLGQYSYFSRHRAVGELIAGEPQARVLDIGCGTGDYATFFDPAATDYLGMDISEKMVEEAARLYPGYAFRVGDGENLPAVDRAFDMVLSVAVLEYFDDPDRHTAELARVTEPGGTVVICVPNAENTTRERDRRLVEKLSFLRGIKRALLGQGAPSPDKDSRVTHHAYSLDEMRVLGGRFGLELADFRYVNCQIVPMPLDQYLRLNPKLSTRLEQPERQRRNLAKAARAATILCCKYRRQG